MTETHPYPAAPADSFPLTALRIVFFTGFALVATVLAFVFLPLAGAALAALIAWRGFDGGYGDFALRALSMVAFAIFAVVATVMGFVFLAPAGAVLAVLFLWRGFGGERRRPARPAVVATGNSAFDAYRAETLKRLEREQAEFLAFLQRLRAAKDKSEFDAFMAARNRRPAPKAEAADPAPETDPWSNDLPILLPRPDLRPGLAR